MIDTPMPRPSWAVMGPAYTGGPIQYLWPELPQPNPVVTEAVLADLRDAFTEAGRIIAELGGRRP